MDAFDQHNRLIEVSCPCVGSELRIVAGVLGEAGLPLPAHWRGCRVVQRRSPDLRVIAGCY